MAAPLVASIIDFVLGLKLGPDEGNASNRWSLEGLSLTPKHDGLIRIGIDTLEATSLWLRSGSLGLEVGRMTLHKLAAELQIDAARPRLCTVEAADAEILGAKLHGPFIVSLHGNKDPHGRNDGGPRPSGDTTASGAIADSWCLGPLAAADGSIRGKITDAHLLFDADVTVPIRQGRIDFNDASVEHVGPDSRMGVSRLGIYVDAPNGRSYLYQFTAVPVGGVEFERRGALLGPWVSERGNLRLQAFGEALLRQGRDGHGLGFTEQARLLLGRTALSGDLQLSDGRFAVPGMQADLAGRADGRNAVRVLSEAVGRGLTVEMPSFSAGSVVLKSPDTQVRFDKMTARLMLRVFVASAQLRFALDVQDMKISRLRLQAR